MPLASNNPLLKLVLLSEHQFQLTAWASGAGMI